MHKNQLQELAQRSGFNLPSYSCIREGPDHAPKFKATVSFNGETFSSPCYFASLRQAEHAAAEVALKVFSQRSPAQASIAKILDESGVCKNLLQETAQRANVPLPNYNTVRSGPGHLPVFTCTVEVAGLQFTGDAARTKKQAEKNAALAAWAALKRFAGRGQSMPQEDADLTDEQEQALIARALANAHAANAIKSSPAILSQAEAAQRGLSFMLPAPTPAPRGVAAAPLYTRSRSSMTGQQQQQASMQPQQGQQMPSMTAPAGGPLYVPRHVNPTWSRADESPAGPTSVNPSTRSFSPSEVIVTEISEEEAQAYEVAAAVAAAASRYGAGFSSNQIPAYGDVMAPHVSQFPRLTHSSPVVEALAGSVAAVPPRSLAPGPSYVRRTSAVAGVAVSGNAGGINKSVPNFPTQTLLAQSVPQMPGVGLPPASLTSAAPGSATNAPSLSAHIGMAYQPRVQRASTTNRVSDVMGSAPSAHLGAAAFPSSGSHDNPLVASLPAGLEFAEDAFLAGMPSIVPPSRPADNSIWAATDRELSPNSYWRSANRAAGMAAQPSVTVIKKGVIGSGRSAASSSAAPVASAAGADGTEGPRPCRVALEEEEVSSEVEATARQMLSHLCL